jgi:hypothetical protein
LTWSGSVVVISQIVIRSHGLFDGYHLVSR